MKTRCYRKKDKCYKNYGGRGIEVCNEWKNNFKNFYEWAINKWQPGLTIDRENTNGNYCPENCRFVDRFIQNNNTRRNHKLEAWGETKNIFQWIRDPRCVIKTPNGLLKRLKLGWKPEDALTIPAKQLNLPKIAKKFEAFGEFKSILEWIRDDRCLIKNKYSLINRINKGWPIEKALTTPVNIKYSRKKK